MPLISIIIPIYNAGLYLDKCIKSVISQPFADFELILVNDGSTDSSSDICAKYARIDQRIIIIQQTNSGVSVARNAGLNIASGKYLMFVDADDWLEDNAFSCIEEVLRLSYVDILQFGYYYINIKGTRSSKSPALHKQYNTLKEYSDDLNYVTSVWGYLFLRQIILDNKILFNESVRYGEDQEFTLKCFFYGNIIYTINKPLYNYNDVITSVMHQAYTYSRAQNTLFILDNLLSMYLYCSVDTKSLWNKEIKLLFENYYRIISKLPYSLKLVKRVFVDLNGLYLKRKLEVDIIFENKFSVKPFFITWAIFYYKIRVLLYRIKHALK